MIVQTYKITQLTNLSTCSRPTQFPSCHGKFKPDNQKYALNLTHIIIVTLVVIVAKHYLKQQFYLINFNNHNKNKKQSVLSIDDKLLDVVLLKQFEGSGLGSYFDVFVANLIISSIKLLSFRFPLYITKLRNLFIFQLGPAINFFLLHATFVCHVYWWCLISRDDAKQPNILLIRR